MSFDRSSLVTKSQGVKRTLASLFAFAAMASSYIPALAPYQVILAQIAGTLGAVGVAHAAIASE